MEEYSTEKSVVPFCLLACFPFFKSIMKLCLRPLYYFIYGYYTPNLYRVTPLVHRCCDNVCCLLLCIWLWWFVFCKIFTALTLSKTACVLEEMRISSTAPLPKINWFVITKIERNINARLLKWYQTTPHVRIILPSKELQQIAPGAHVLCVTGGHQRGSSRGGEGGDRVASTPSKNTWNIKGRI